MFMQKGVETSLQACPRKLKMYKLIEIAAVKQLRAMRQGHDKRRNLERVVEYYILQFMEKYMVNQDNSSKV